MISLEKWMISTPLQKLPNNVGNLDKKLLPKALNGYPNCKKLPNPVTLLLSHFNIAACTVLKYEYGFIYQHDSKRC